MVMKAPGGFHQSPLPSYFLQSHPLDLFSPLRLPSVIGNSKAWTHPGLDCVNCIPMLTPSKTMAHILDNTNKGVS